MTSLQSVAITLEAAYKDPISKDAMANPLCLVLLGKATRFRQSGSSDSRTTGPIFYGMLPILKTSVELEEGLKILFFSCCCWCLVFRRLWFWKSGRCGVTAGAAAGARFVTMATTSSSFAGLETFVPGETAETGSRPGSRGGAHKPLVLDPVERVRRFGIETSGPFGDGICFRGGEWVVGGEYVQKLTVKNVSRRLRKLKYKLPEVPYFTMVFPELINLSPGMHVDIDIVFRPVHNDVYDDTIYFKVCDSEGAGGFHVPCRALISTLQASIPAGLEAGGQQAADCRPGRLFGWLDGID